MRIISSEDVGQYGIDPESTFDKEVNREETTSTIKIQILKLFSEKRAKWILFLIVYNTVVISQIYAWADSTNSLALRAYANTIIFNVFALVVCLISVWVSQNISSSVAEEIDLVKKGTEGHSRSYSSCGYPKYQKNETQQRSSRHSISGPCFAKDSETLVDLPAPSSLSILGLEKYEVLALLVSSCLSLAVGSLIAIEAVGRIKDQPTIHTGRLGLGALLGLLTHVTTVYGHRDAALDHVVCRALPCPTLKDYNPILGGNILGAAILCGAHLLIHYWDTHIADTAAAFAVLGLLVASMLPLAFYTASIILQKLPHYMGEQLDKCLREALNIDGVLEIRNERFWTQSFGKLAGTVQVRIRRDADESHVLERVMAGLSRIVTTLTVQEFRESRRIQKFEVQHCAEYYINELLPNTADDRAARKCADDEMAEIETLKIDDILGVEKEPAGTFIPTQMSLQMKSVGIKSNQIEKRTNTLSICEFDIDVKNHLYHPNKHNHNVNILIIGSNGDDERFIDSAIRLT